LLKLLEGIKKFKKESFEPHKHLFQSLKEEQNPHTLFITCSDSRVDPNLITCTLPGELFIVRNIANIVPPYRDTEEYVATTSAIEYGVLALGVENIIICGHSNCGGCTAAFQPEAALDHMPHTSKWLELIDPVKKSIDRELQNETPENRRWLMEQMNVVEQLHNLRSYPYVAQRIAAGKLQISGWHYIIETGEVLIYDQEQRQFLLANG
jgi:carbonic anhydrase